MCPPDRIPAFPVGLLSEWAAFFSRYPCVCEAVTAAAAGEAVEVLSLEHTPFRRRVFVRDGLPWQEDTFYIDMDLREAVLTGYLNHSDPGTAEKHILGLLPQLVPDWARGNMLCVAEPSAFLPRFGYRYLVALDGARTWEEADARAKGHIGMVEEMEYQRDGLNSDSHIGALQEAGLPVVPCQGCDKVLTCHHPDWRGTWVCLDAEDPVRCHYAYRRVSSEEQLDDIHVGLPHQPDPNAARSVAALR